MCQQTSKFRMSLDKLPEEVLEKIAYYMDAAALTAFGMLGGKYLYSSRRVASEMKLRIVPGHTQEYLRLNGSLVRSLHLMASGTPRMVVSGLITHCPGITDLRLAGTELTCEEIWNLADQLVNLRELSITVSPPAANGQDDNCGESQGAEQFDDIAAGREFKHLRDLYVEIVGLEHSFNFIVDLMNRSPVLEGAKVIVISTSREGQVGSIDLTPQRWTTLRTLIVSHFDPHYGHSGTFIGFLEQLFRHGIAQESLWWIREKKDSYIYHDGKLNRIISVEEDVAQEPHLVEEYQLIRIPLDKTTPPQTPRGRPRKLRIMGENGMTEDQVRASRESWHTWSSELVELDLTELHSDCLGLNPQLKLIPLSPALEAVAMTPCALGNLFRDKHREYIGEPRLRRDPGVMALCAGLSRLRLKKFCLKGNSWCVGCVAGSLRLHNVPDLTELRFLEELNLSRVEVEDSAYNLLANPHMRTVKFCLWPRSSFNGLASFLSQCVNVKNFKLDAPLLPLQNTHIWEKLAACESLKQLCLGSRNKYYLLPDRGYPRTKAPFDIFLLTKDRDHLLESVRRLCAGLELFHLHAQVLIRSEAAPPISLDQYIRGLKGSKSRSEPSTAAPETFVGPEEESLEESRFIEEPPTFAGRGLCCSESFIGLIEPEGWSVD